MGKRMTDEDREEVLMLIESGAKAKDIAQALGWEKSTVNLVARFSVLAKQGDFETLNTLRENHRPLYEWVMRKYGTPTPVHPSVKDNSEKILVEILMTLVDEIKETNQLLQKLL